MKLFNAILGGFFLILGITSNAQLKIEEMSNQLVIQDSIKLSKGQKLKINKPYAYDYSTIKKVDGLASIKNIVSVAQLGGIVGGSIGGLTGNANTMIKSSQILTTANQVDNIIWSADKIQKLNISKNAKKIVGREFIITGWEEQDQVDGFYLKGTIDNKKYTIQLQSAIILKEIVL